MSCQAYNCCVVFSYWLSDVSDLLYLCPCANEFRCLSQRRFPGHHPQTEPWHILLEPFNITPLCDDPERAHTVGAVYWEARPLGSSDGGLIKCIVGEDWIVQRIPSGELKIALYINS